MRVRIHTFFASKWKTGDKKNKSVLGIGSCHLLLKSAFQSLSFKHRLANCCVEGYIKTWKWKDFSWLLTINSCDVAIVYLVSFKDDKWQKWRMTGPAIECDQLLPAMELKYQFYFLSQATNFSAFAVSYLSHTLHSFCSSPRIIGPKERTVSPDSPW